MKIALDVDGVLADVIESWLIFNNKKRTQILKEDIKNWDFWKEFEINQYDFYDELSSCWKNWTSIPPTENNLSFTSKSLCDLGRVDIVTAREKSTDIFVKNWLKFNGIQYENYVSVIDGPMKADLNYDIFIDDSPLNAMRFLKNGKTVFLYSQPWNQHISNKNITRILKLSEVIDQL